MTQPTPNRLTKQGRETASDEPTTASAPETTVQWAEPPAAAAGPAKYVAVRAQLKARPNEWAVISESPLSSRIASDMRATAVWAGFEVIARGRKVYARYIGEVAP